MAAITAKMVSDLRAKTGVGMMECKKALNEANGDFDEAVKILREKGLSVAAKKAGRVASEGVVDIMSENGVTVMIEVNAETDFVAKNETFKEFVRGIEKVILANKPATLEELNALAYDDNFTVEAKLKDMIFTIGENMNIRRFEGIEGITSAYIHGAGTTGVVVKFNTTDDVAAKAEFAAFAKNIALQIGAFTTPYLDRDSVPASVLEDEKAIILAQMANDPKNAGKPANILEKMVIGKLGKFYESNCLVDMEYVKAEDHESVGKYVANTAKAMGGKIAIASFVRFEKGEGIEKKQEDYAAEIAKLSGVKQ